MWTFNWYHDSLNDWGLTGIIHSRMYKVACCHLAEVLRCGESSRNSEPVFFLTNLTKVKQICHTSIIIIVCVHVFVTWTTSILCIHVMILVQVCRVWMVKVYVVLSFSISFLFIIEQPSDITSNQRSTSHTPGTCMYIYIMDINIILTL